MTDTASDEFGILLSRLLRKAMMILQGRAALIALMRPDGSRLIPVRACHGLSADQIAAIDIDRLRVFSQFALTAKEPITLNSQLECIGALGDAAGSALSNCLCVPLLAQVPRLAGTDDPIVGMLMLFNKPGGAFTEEDRTLSTVLGRQMAAVIFEQQRRDPIL